MIDKQTLIDHLARCGMVFMRGEPPSNLDHFILAYTGDCNAVRASWDKKLQAYVGDDKWVLTEEPDWRKSRDRKHYQGRILCWMYLPHPSIWPEVDAPADLISDRDLYNEHEGNVLDWMS